MFDYKLYKVAGYAATVEIDESNDSAGEVVTHNITNTNMGSVDAANLDAVANPLAPSTNSYEKYQRIHVTAMGGSSKIDNLKVWRDSAPALATGATHLTNARETSYVATTTFTAPVATTSSVATQTMPTAEPSGANLGIGGSLTGSLTGVGSSDYLVHQLQLDGSAVAGVTVNMNYQYDETA